MTNGVTLQLTLYYRDASSNMVTIAATTVTNSIEAFPNNTNFVDFQVHLPTVQPGAPWAGQHIGIQLLSTVDFTLAGGYWDLDNVRLSETPLLALSTPIVSNGQFAFTVLSQAGVQFAIQASSDINTASSSWVTLATITNSTGVTPFSDSTVMSNTGSAAVAVRRMASGVHCRISKRAAPVTTMTRLRDRYTR